MRDKAPDSAIDASFKIDMDYCAWCYYEGHRDMLFEAIKLCDQYQRPHPQWVFEELQKGLQVWRSGAVREFGEAFGIARREGQLPAKVKRYNLAVPVYQEIERRRAAGESMTNETWEAVAQLFGINRDLAKDYCDYVKKATGEWSAKIAAVQRNPK